MSNISPILEYLLLDKSTGGKKTEDSVDRALKLVKFIGKLDKDKKKEEEDKKKKDSEKKNKMPEFSLPQILILGQVFGFGWYVLLEYIKVHWH